MAQRLIKIKSLGNRQTYSFGIDTPEHLWDYKGLISNQSFNAPHSVAYSLLGYVQAYLKYYYPLEFWIATLSTIERGKEKHEQSTLGKYINSITQSGIKVVKPDVNKSEFDWYGENDTIYFALSYIKDVAKGATQIIENRPYRDFNDFLTKSKEKKFNKRVVKGLIFSGAVDFNDTVNDRYYKWLLFLSDRGIKELKDGTKKWSSKKDKDEFDYFKKNQKQYFDLIHDEYEHCKYSFTGLDEFIATNKELKQIKTISQREERKPLWVLLGYISNITTKQSKKSKNKYVFITLTDFRDTISVFAFGDKYREKILSNFSNGDLVKIGIKNDGGWIKLPWESEYSGKFPIEKISIS